MTVDHHVRNRYILIADLVLISISAWGAYVLRFDWVGALRRDEFLVYLTAVLLLKPFTFHAFGLYRRYWRYASLSDLLAVVLASTASAILAALAMAGFVMFDLIDGFPRTVIPIDWLMTMTLAGGVRMTVRVVAEMRRPQEGLPAVPAHKRVLVAGAGHAGVMVVKEMQRNPHLGLVPVGFLDDEPSKHRKTILGVKVLGTLDQLAAKTGAVGADEVIIALPTATGTIVRSVVEQCRAVGLPSRVIPGVFELLDGKVTVNRLRNVEIFDLLRRAQVPMPTATRAYIRGRVILVTGAGGSIGAEVCRQVAHDGPRTLVLLGHGENSVFDIQSHLAEVFPELAIAAVVADVRDRGRLETIFRQYRPDVVVHAAAHKHVPLMEANPEEAITNNVIGTRNIVDCALRFEVSRMVMISTDKAVAPTNMMGASKRLAEIIVREAAHAHGRQFAVVRFGNVLGSRGSVVPIFKAQIERGGPLTVTHPDVRRYFMTVPEAVHLVLEAGGHATGGELFVLNMGEPVRIVDLAQDLVELSGLKRGEIEIQFTGLRPGEKLDERLWEEGSRAIPTPTSDVLQVFEPHAGIDLARAIAALERALESRDSLELRACVADLLPTFVPPTPTHEVL